VNEKNNIISNESLKASLTPEEETWRPPSNTDLQLKELQKLNEETLKENTSLKEELELAKSQLSGELYSVVPALRCAIQCTV